MTNFLKFLKINVKSILLCLILLFFMLVFISFPEKYLKSCYKGIVLWALNVLPSLLPFFFLTALLTKTAKISSISQNLSPLSKFLFNNSGICFYPFIMSVLSGYPVGSSIVNELYTQKLINKDQATKISVLASTSGPLFIVGTVGVCMFKNKLYGFIILISHIFATILSAITLRNYKKSSFQNNSVVPFKKVDNILYESMYNSVISILLVGGFIAISYVLSDICSDLNLLMPLEKLISILFSPFNIDKIQIKGFCYGLIECTRGSQFLSTSTNYALSVALTTSIISFGGLSIFLQSITHLKKANVNLKIFCLGKLLSSVYAFIICYLIFIILGL